MTGTRRRRWFRGLWVGTLGLCVPAAAALARDPQAKRAVPQGAATTPEERLLQALQANPVTAPFRFTVKRVNGKYALSGRVASGAVHDFAIQTAIELGVPVRDDLVIDTGLGALLAPSAPPGGFAVRGPLPLPGLGPFDFPVVTFDRPLLVDPSPYPVLDAFPAPGGPPGLTLPSDSVELTVDVRGVAYLRGTVPSLEDREALARKVAAVPGIVQVVNLLAVNPEVAALVETPPPPPRPIGPIPPAEPPVVVPKPPAIEATDPLVERVDEAILRRPALNGLRIQVGNRDGVVTLSGDVPTVYEAMVAYRAAQQTPGVREVEDRLSFALPEEGRVNPLARKGRPEDIEPFLLAHVRRQLGDAAHVDQVEVQGDALEIQGTVDRQGDVARVEATLRSIPLLRGFRLQPRFLKE
ncbi:MAG: BON domain-containing protein [Isosphaeraceae bacterium]